MTSKNIKDSTGENNVALMSMDAILDVWRTRKFIDVEKKLVVTRLLSYSDYFYNHGDSPYSEMGIKFSKDLCEESPDDPDCQIMAGNVYAWLNNDNVNASKHFINAIKITDTDCAFYKKAIGSLCLAEKYMEAGALLKKYEAKGLKCIDKGDMKMIKETIEKQKVKYDGDLSIIRDPDFPDEESDEVAGKGGAKSSNTITAMNARQKYYNVFIFVGLAIFFLKGMLMQGPENEPYLWLWRNPGVLISVCALIFYVLFKYPAWFDKTPIVMKIILAPIFGAMILLLLTPIVMYINAYAGTPVKDDTRYVVNGTMERKNKYSTDFILTLKDPVTNAKFEWKADRGDSKNGEGYATGFYKGTLGIPFKYKYK